MRTIGIILSGIIFLLITLILSAIIWTDPFIPTVPIYIQILAGVNYFFAGTVAGNIAERFYKWFKSQLK